MSYDLRYLVWALCYGVAGIVLGIYMAASDNHSQLVTHAHILLVGFVVSFIYSVIYRLWLRAPSRVLATIQLALHQTGALAMFTGLLLLYAGVTADYVKALLGFSAIAVLLAVLLMLALVLKHGPQTAAQPTLSASR